MARSSSVLLLLAASLVSGAAPQPTHTWIADVKANRARLGPGEVRIQGDIVELRSTSPTAARGLYRLIDASDATGVLIRTDDLPQEGGAYLVRARVAAEQPDSGLLYLDEVDRGRTDGPSVLPAVGAGVSLILLVIIGVLLGRAMVQERHYLIRPPLWLLPQAGPYGKAVTVPGTVPPPMKYEPELEEADRRQRETLRRRKRTLFQALLGSMALTGVNATWMLQTRPASAQVPAFVFIDANELPARPLPPAAPPEPGFAKPAPILQFESTPARGSRRDSAAARRTNPAKADSTPTAVIAALPPAPPVVPPSAPPAPPPPAAAPEAAAPKAPPRDPAEERARAGAAIADGAGRIVAAINDRKTSALASLLPEARAGDLGRRERLLKLVKDFGPTAVLGPIEDFTPNDDRGEASFTVSFTWRGDFGVDRRKSARFQGAVRREGGAWRFDGANLLDPIP